jgi:Flp pilus assembly pilin Flp
VSDSFAVTRVDPNRPFEASPFHCAQRAPDLSKGGDINVTFTDLIHYLRARFQVEEGQTMAEYGVVLAVIAVAVVVALGFLSGAISGAIDKVTSILNG